MKTFVEQARGQMLRKHIHPQLFIFKQCRDVNFHTFFVRESLDIAAIDENCRVTVKVTIPSNRFFTMHGKYILEMKGGTCPYQVGNHITITPMESTIHP